jgi:hypothetical protein
MQEATEQDSLPALELLYEFTREKLARQLSWRDRGRVKTRVFHEVVGGMLFGYGWSRMVWEEECGNDSRLTITIDNGGNDDRFGGIMTILGSAEIAFDLVDQLRGAAPAWPEPADVES